MVYGFLYKTDISNALVDDVSDEQIRENISEKMAVDMQQQFLPTK